MIPQPVPSIGYAQAGSVDDQRVVPSEPISSAIRPSEWRCYKTQELGYIFGVSGQNKATSAAFCSGDEFVAMQTEFGLAAYSLNTVSNSIKTGLMYEGNSLSKIYKVTQHQNSIAMM
jgi:hypothetical protein